VPQRHDWDRHERDARSAAEADKALRAELTGPSSSRHRRDEPGVQGSGRYASAKSSARFCLEQAIADPKQ
jgi:hypothetical protein